MHRTPPVRRLSRALAVWGTVLVLTLGTAAVSQAAPPGRTESGPTATAPAATSSVQPGDRPDSTEGSGFPWVKVILGVAALGLVTVAVVGARTRRSLDRPDDDRRPPADR